jgi:hypothetical protein
MDEPPISIDVIDRSASWEYALRAADTGYTTVQVGGKLHGIQVTPDALFPLIMLGGDSATLRARPLVIGVLDCNVDTVTGHVQVDVTD